MKEEKQIIKLKEDECRILIRCLNDKRTELLRQEKSTDAVDELLLKVIDAPSIKIKRERQFEER